VPFWKIWSAWCSGTRGEASTIHSQASGRQPRHRAGRVRMTQHTEAFWVVSPQCGEIRPEALPDPHEGEVRVRALYSAVSRGTESLIWRGAVPQAEYTRMRAPFQSGDFPFPVKYGYASVGVVEAGDAALLGRTVFCLYPHQTRYAAAC
jgi:hypothetical protein